MARAHVGYAAMLEQFGPQEVVGYSARAEAAGFQGVMAADHFQPWVPQQGQAPFVWSVMTMLGERTTADFGPGVVCPSFRMHPAVVAQASATRAHAYPGRHWLGLGSGEALNEHVVAAANLLGHAGRSDGHSVLVVLDLGRDADAHDRSFGMWLTKIVKNMRRLGNHDDEDSIEYSCG